MKIKTITFICLDYRMILRHSSQSIAVWFFVDEVIVRLITADSDYFRFGLRKLIPIADLWLR